MAEQNTAVETRSPQDLTSTEGTRPGVVVAPLVDIYETQETITLLADMPGVSQDDLTIDLNEGVLTLTGHTTGVPNTEDRVGSEFRAGTFQRKFTLSDSIDQTKIEAQLELGVLKLQLPKAAKAKVRKITVQGA